MTKFTGLLASAAIFAVSAFSASAAIVTVDSITGVWSTATLESGGAPSGVGTKRITWGTSTGYGRSSYVFEAASTPFSPLPETQFTFGEFTHNNFPVTGNALTSAVLSLAIGVSIDGVGHTLEASYLFTHNETPNQWPCLSGSVSVCDDIVSFTPIVNSFDTVDVDGTEYTFLLDNFIDEDGNPVNSFWTQERRTNSASLVGRFTAELPTENPPPVPLPASILLLGAGLGGAGALSRFRRRG